MGRKVDMKKIEDTTKCQVTFSKRRSSLMKKAHEISVYCDVDVAFIAFSPSGRISKFCSQKRIEDVLCRYVNLPADKRYNQIWNIQEKHDKLRQLDHIKGDNSKLHYVDKQIENLELQIKKSTLELQILEADLRDYEPHQEQEPSLHQLLWCERNLKQSFQKVMAKKMDLMELENQCGMPFSYNSQVREPNPSASAGQLIMQLDPWISPYRARVRESMFKELLDQARRTPAGSQAPGTSSSHTCNLLIADFPVVQQSGVPLPSTLESPIPPTYTPMQRHLVANQSAPNQKLGALDSQAMGMVGSSALSEIQQHPPDTVEHHVNNQIREDVVAPMVQLNLNCKQGNWFNRGDYSSNESLNFIQRPILESNNSSTIYGNDNGSGEASETLDQPPKVPENSLFYNLPSEDILGDEKLWTTRIQESGLWEWDDLVMADNFNLEALDNFF